LSTPLLSRITFWWLNPLILTGFRKELKREDMWQLEEKEECRVLTDQLEREWSQAAARF